MVTSTSRSQLEKQADDPPHTHPNDPENIHASAHPLVTPSALRIDPRVWPSVWRVPSNRRTLGARQPAPE